MYEFYEVSEGYVLELVQKNPKLKQPQLLALIYPPLKGAEPDAPYGREPDPTGLHPEGGNPIKAPHLQLEQHLKALRSKRLVDFQPKGITGGWIAL